MVNIFDGNSCRTSFVRYIYERLMGRSWFTYADVMTDFIGKPLEYNVSKCPSYGELRKAFSDLKKAIGTANVETMGNNRTKKFRYIGEEDDPLCDLRQAKAISDIRKYYEFCQDSAGFFPTSWLDYFLKDSLDLLDIRQRRRRGEQFVSTSVERKLKNIEMLPFLYEAIHSHKVLSVIYKPYDEEETTLVFHPHFLKEHNGRWHFMGHAEGKTPSEGFNLSIDRIVHLPQVATGKKWVAAPTNFYEQYFKDIVGTTHRDGNAPKDVHVRAYSNYIFNITDTKPIHPSQQVVKSWGHHDDGEYGEFVVHVEINNEFIGRILMMGDKLEVVAPVEVRNIFRKRVASVAP